MFTEKRGGLKIEIERLHALRDEQRGRTCEYTEGKMARHVAGGPEGHGVMGTEERKRLRGGVATRVSGSQDNQRR